MKARDGFILRNLAGEYILAPAGKRIREFQGIVVMNELSAFIWDHLREDTSREKLLGAVLAAYDVDEVTAAADLDEILTRMNAQDLIDL